MDFGAALGMLFWGISLDSEEGGSLRFIDNERNESDDKEGRERSQSPRYLYFYPVPRHTDQRTDIPLSHPPFPF